LIFTVLLVSGLFALRCQAQPAAIPKDERIQQKIPIPEATQRHNEDRNKQIANLRDPKWIEQQIAILQGQNNEAYQVLIETKFSPDSVDYSTVRLEGNFILLSTKQKNK
jgi:hypothetical protein